MSSGAPSVSLADAAKAFGSVFEQGARLGIELLDSIRLPLPRQGCCSCNIPPPCWEPQPAGDVRTQACRGDRATLRLRIRNCGSTARAVTVEVTNKAVSASPDSITIEPYEDATVVLSLEIPASAEVGERQKSVVWVRGCNTHYLRWTVEVARRGAGRCRDVDIDDCPDLVHHWYDHFYCDRPCPHQG